MNHGRMCSVKLYNMTEYGEGLSHVVREYLGESGGAKVIPFSKFNSV